MWHPDGTLHPTGTHCALPSVCRNSVLNPLYLASAVGVIRFSLCQRKSALAKRSGAVRVIRQHLVLIVTAIFRFFGVFIT